MHNSPVTFTFNPDTKGTFINAIENQLKDLEDAAHYTEMSAKLGGDEFVGLSSKGYDERAYQQILQCAKTLEKDNMECIYPLLNHHSHSEFDWGRFKDDMNEKADIARLFEERFNKGKRHEMVQICKEKCKTLPLCAVPSQGSFG